MPSASTHDTGTPDTPDTGASEKRSTMVDRFAELSRSYAERGEARLAVHAMWGSDIELLQQLLWESGLGEAPDPLAQVAAVGDAVVGSLEVAAPQSHSGTTARGAVERAREAMVATFDESVHQMLADRFLPLDHLDLLPAPTSEDAVRSAATRLGARTAHQLAADLRTTAADCMAVAEVMLLEDDMEGALRQVRQADLASFEAYLVLSAIQAGDTALASVDLRWDLAAMLAQDTGSEADDLDEAAGGWRDRMVGLVGSVEAGALRAFFEPVPTR